jgi:hypothetical protein
MAATAGTTSTGARPGLRQPERGLGSSAEGGRCCLDPFSFLIIFHSFFIFNKKNPGPSEMNYLRPAVAAFARSASTHAPTFSFVPLRILNPVRSIYPFRHESLVPMTLQAPRLNLTLSHVINSKQRSGTEDNCERNRSEKHNSDDSHRESFKFAVNSAAIGERTSRFRRRAHSINFVLVLFSCAGYKQRYIFLKAVSSLAMVILGDYGQETFKAQCAAAPTNVQFLLTYTPYSRRFHSFRRSIPKFADNPAFFCLFCGEVDSKETF